MLPTYLLFSRFLPYLQIGDKEIHMKRILIIGITLLTIGITAFSLINEKEPKEIKSPTAEKDYPIDFSLEDKDGNKYSVKDNKVVVEGEIKTKDAIEKLFPNFHTLLRIHK